jgi:glutamyl-tRNA synthetase
MKRVRFAPSPTGYLHIGGARTALFNWLFAQSQIAAFVLRIEDTDVARSKKEFVDEILDSLKWLGFNWDEVYFQSQRFNIYKEFADKLVKEGKAYIEKLPDKPGEAVIYKVAPQTIKINDLIRGEIVFDSETIKDQVLIKSDGTPTYNFACVVDDASMNITHIIRGDDHISNTPKQILIYEALGFNVPQFAHLPLIMGTEGRLSKRTGATAISDYRSMGYLPEALVNYLLLLSWSPGDNREVIDIKEAIKLFDIKNVNKTAAAFDLKKLNWINNQYLKGADPEKLTDEILPQLIERKFITKDNFDRGHIVSLMKLFQGRLNTLRDFPDWADFFFLDEITIDPEAQNKYLSKDLSKEFALFIKRLDALEVFDVVSIEKAFRDLVAELGLEAKVLIHPIRVALTGKTIGPGLFDVIYYLGIEKVKIRLSKFIRKE